jgi:hypothetical protein
MTPESPTAVRLLFGSSGTVQNEYYFGWVDGDNGGCQ